MPTDGETSFIDLPAELIIRVLSYLDISDLYNIADTCRGLQSIINDQELWKNLFIQRFGTTRFSSLSKSSKFSVELFERNDVIHRWRKATGTHRITSIPSSSIERVLFDYPKILSFNDQGDVNILSVDKKMSDATIPITTTSGYTVFSFNPSAIVVGRWDGKVFGKLLTSRSYLKHPVTKFDRSHDSPIYSISHDESFCYTGDESGSLFTWNLKTGTFSKSFKLSSKPILQVQGWNNHTIIALDDSSIYVIEGSTVRTVDRETNDDSLEVDFGGKIIVVAGVRSIKLISFGVNSFGRYQTIDVGENDEIFKYKIEDKVFSQVDYKVAGYDGCNLGLVTRAGRVLVFNIRDIKLDGKSDFIQPRCEFVPMFDSLKIPNGIPPISSIALNSTVVLLGSYNGFAAVYDVLTGVFLKLVSSRISKRYLPLIEPPYLVAVNAVHLGSQYDANGILVVNNVVQYFQFGELVKDQLSQKKKKSLSGFPNSRKNKLYKKIRHDINEIDFEEHEELKKEKLLDMYNGSELLDEEQIEIAMVLNKSLHEKNRENTGKEIASDTEFDEDLIKAIERSRLDLENAHREQDYVGPSSAAEPTKSITEPSSNGEANDDDAEFQKQLEEAMRRSLYE